MGDKRVASIRPEIAGFTGVDPETTKVEAELKVMSLLLQSVVRENIDGWGAQARWDGDTLSLGELRAKTTPRASLGQFGLSEFPTWNGRHVGNTEQLLQFLDLRGERERLAEELKHCSANLALCRAAAQKRRSEGVEQLVHVRDFEQWVVEGHPLHPCAKMRWPLTPEQQARYAPEFGARFGVPLIAVANASCHQTGIGSNQALAQDYPELWADVQARVDTDEFTVLPIHPYQRQHVLADLCGPWLEDGTIVTLDPLAIPVAPLMSFRSLEPTGGRRYQLKTAVGVRMTNAVRTVSPQAAENGPELSRVLAKLNQEEDFGALRFLHEVGGAYVSGRGWDIARNFSVLFRESPESHVEPGQQGMPGAALLELGPSGNHLVLDQVERAGSTERFVEAYCEAILPPLLRLLSVYGIALEAHLQNCVVVFEEGRLVKVLYRDFGGVRFHSGRLREVGLEVSFHPGSATLVEDVDDLRSKLFYPLFQNHLGELFRTLAGHGLDEDWAWRLVASISQRTFSQLEGAFVEEDRDALFAPFWSLKRVGWMRLNDKVTEYTFAPLLNPLFESDTERFQSTLSGPLKEYYPEATEQANSLVCDQLKKALRREQLLADLDDLMEHREILLRGYQSYPDWDWPTLALEIDNAVANLALILAHRKMNLEAASPWQRLKVAEDSLQSSESLCLGGHNLHPCARTRLGIDVQGLLSGAAELGGQPTLRLVSLAEELAGWTTAKPEQSPNDYARNLFPGLKPEVGRVYLLAHEWQCDHVVPNLYADELASGELRLEDETIVGRATAAFRTVILSEEWTSKVSIGSQMTSTTRCISHQTALNGPRITALLQELQRVVPGYEILEESCGVHFRSTDSRKSRNLTCLYRRSLASVLEPGEIAVSGASLTTVLGEILTEFEGGAEEFFDEYLCLVLPPHLRLFSEYGIALEAHLQNCIVTFRRARPYRLFLRDWGGLRIDMERLHQAGYSVELAADSLTEAKSLHSAREKLVYCLFRAHIEELVNCVSREGGVSTSALWTQARDHLTALYEDIDRPEDLATFLSPTWNLKALTRMRLQPDQGYIYVEHPNPLYTPRASEISRSENVG